MYAGGKLFLKRFKIVVALENSPWFNGTTTRA
jgi:hypothetical protein